MEVASEAILREIIPGLDMDEEPEPPDEVDLAAEDCERLIVGFLSIGVRDDVGV